MTIVNCKLIDNEVPAFGEWDSVVTGGDSTIIQSADAAWPERGNIGLRCTVVNGAGAYVRKNNFCPTFGSGDTLAVGFWFRLESHAVAAWGHILDIRLTASGRVAFVDIEADRRLSLRVWDEEDWDIVYTSPLTLGRWVYVVVKLTKGAGAWIYVDGVKYTNGIDDPYLSGSGDYIDLGCMWAISDWTASFDEVKIADAYPEPFVPTPADEYPSARRTVVIFRAGNADSTAFADYCVSQAGVPRANLCPVPCTGNELVANYATFQSEVETPLADWLALNPTVAANVSCFLLGYGVPGAFVYAGAVYSAPSRLMNYGTAFSPQTANPLYKPAIVARLTRTALGGKYLAGRIDADSLANVKALLDRGAAVSQLPALAAADKLYSDDATYLASLACRHLRVVTAALGTYADDAFVWGDTGSPSFGAAGSRVCFVDDSAYSADKLRTTSELFDAIVTNSYAAGLGNAFYADTFDAESFFEMLRVGGTLAEAVAVAIANLDYTAVPVGWPMMTVNLPKGGYNVYHGLGGPEAIDWQQPVAYTRKDSQIATAALAMAAGRKHVLAVRAISSEGVEEKNTHVIAYAEVDDSYDLLPAPLPAPSDVTAQAQPDGSVLVGFSCHRPLGYATATAFDIFGDDGSGILDFQQPEATISKIAPNQTDFLAKITPSALPAQFTVRACIGDQVGPISAVVTASAGPTPSSPTLL